MQVREIKPYCEPEVFYVEYKGKKYTAERIYGHESRDFKFNLGKNILWAHRCDGGDVAYRVGLSQQKSLDPNAVVWSTEKVWIPNDRSLINPNFKYMNDGFINIDPSKTELTPKGMTALIEAGLNEMLDFMQQHPGLPIKTNLYNGTYEDGKTSALINRSLVEWYDGEEHNFVTFDVVRPFNVDLPTRLQITEHIGGQENTYQRNDLLQNGQDTFLPAYNVREESDCILSEKGFVHLASKYKEWLMTEEKKEVTAQEKPKEERIYIRPSLKNDDREILKQIPGHQYNAKVRIWSVPKESLKQADSRVADMQMYASFKDIFAKKEMTKEDKKALLQNEKSEKHGVKR